MVEGYDYARKADGSRSYERMGIEVPYPKVNFLWFWIKHQFFDFSRFLFLRDRLRCPECKAVGTWKPHGGWLDRGSRWSGRRWMCKWCGKYVGRFQNKGSAVKCRVFIGEHGWNFWDDEVHKRKPFKAPPRSRLQACSGYKEVNPWYG